MQKSSYYSQREFHALPFLSFISSVPNNSLTSPASIYETCRGRQRDCPRPVAGAVQEYPASRSSKGSSIMLARFLPSFHFSVAPLLLSVLYGCHSVVRGEVAPAPAVRHGIFGLPYEAPGLSMPQRLGMIDEGINPFDVLNENHRKAAMARAEMEIENDPDRREMLRLDYANELLNAGETEEAIRQFTRVENYAKSHHPSEWTQAREAIQLATAVAYLRLGEQENCLLNHTSESCLLPIRGAGIHKLQRGSRGAIKYLTQIL